METLQVLTYNNYYNKILKRGLNLNDYAEFVVYQLEQTNFNPNDGVTTEHIVGGDDFNGVGNYVLIINGSEIVSRWFIIESIRTRYGQYKLILFRDLLVDYYDTIIDSPIFVEKAIPNASSPFIFNRENMSYNQIKKGEWLLKDKTKCPWLVGYYSKKISGDNALSGTVAQDNSNHITLPFMTIEEWGYYRYRQETGNLFYSPATNFTLHLYFNTYADGGYRKLNVNINRNNRDYSSQLYLRDVDSGNSTVGGYSYNKIGQIANAILTNNYFVGWNAALVAEGAQGTYEGYQDFMSYNNKLVHTNDGKVYEIKVIRASVDSKLTKIIPGGGLARDHITPLLETIPEVVTVSPNENSYAVTTTLSAYQLDIFERASEEITYDISSGRNCEDEVYNLFAIPYGEVTLQGAQTTTINNPDLALDLVRSIQRNGGSNIYDVQLLPFCPCRDLILEDGSILLSEGAYSMVGNQMVVLYPLFANFSIPELIIEGTTNGMDWSAVPKYGGVEEQKIIAECDEVRLVSPNYNGQFSFNIARNNGIPGFTADCTYKPYSPYIHVNPIFGGLYGKDFNDARGLICQGDFSLSAITDAWVQYEINNKNYNNIFNREIQSMELNNSVAQTKDIFGAITGTITGVAGGALSGAKGGVAGAIVGGVIGGVASGIGGGMDVYYNQLLREEGIDLKRDLYGYHLGNIKALPYSLSKVTALNSNNKLFPFIEYYSCTEEEKQALREKIKYNGMTIMAIGKMSEYIVNTTELQFFKGRLIRFADMTEDYHIVNAIKDELEKGVFIKWDFNQI